MSESGAAPQRKQAPTPGQMLRGLVFLAVFYLATVLMGLANLALYPLGEAAVRRQCEWWSALHRWCVVHILGISVTVEGGVPAGAVLVAMKHESAFEALDSLTFLDHPVVFAKAELLRLPLWGKMGRAYGLIGVEREQGAKALRAMFAEAREKAKLGRPMLIFAEGTRVPHGAQPPLQAGFAGIYKLLGLPVVPVAINSGPCYAHTIKRPGRIVIRFGEPIAPGLAREEIEARVHAAINALNQPPA